MTLVGPCFFVNFCVSVGSICEHEAILCALLTLKCGRRGQRNAEIMCVIAIGSKRSSSKQPRLWQGQERVARDSAVEHGISAIDDDWFCSATTALAIPVEQTERKVSD